MRASRSSGAVVRGAFGGGPAAVLHLSVFYSTTDSVAVAITLQLLICNP